MGNTFSCCADKRRKLQSGEKGGLDNSFKSIFNLYR